MKTHIQRIQFYTRKAAEYSADRRPRHLRNPYRFNRLMAYKNELNRRLNSEGYRWEAAIELRG